MTDRRTKQSVALSAIGIGGAVALAFLPKLIFGPHPAVDPAFIVSTTALMVVAMAWAGAFSIASFRRGDEFMQARSKFAWYWGSLAGLVAMAPLFCFAMLGGFAWIAPSLAVSRQAWTAFSWGLMTPLLAQMLGFFAVAFWTKGRKL